MSAPLVSVIMPLYNCERYVREAVDSVLAQTYGNLELIVVDDCSSDASPQIIELYGDSRIRLLRHEVNRGAAAARNTAIEHARGDYIAFLDSDDAWYPDKLEKQMAFMDRKGAALSFTAYETIEEDGSHRNYVKVPATIDYRGFLKNTVTCGHTILFDLGRVRKEWVMAPLDRGYDFPEDLAVMLGILKRGFTAYGLDEVLAKNRKHSGSRSSNKLRAIRRTWNQYRRGEELSLPYSMYCLFWQLTHAVMKRL